MTYSFYPGQKVIYVGSKEDIPKDQKLHVELTAPKVVVGDVYTIRWVGNASFHFKDGCKDANAVRVQEVTRTFVATKYNDWPYWAAEFRPLESKAIELFRKIAADVTEGKKVKIDG